jgi:hypothetical protein
VNQLEISFGTPLRVVVETAAPQAIVPWLTIWFENFKLTAKGGEVMYTLPVDHSVSMQVAYVDAAGNPATVDGKVNWQTSDPTIANVAASSEDSTIVEVTPGGTLGQAQISARVDADLGQGVRLLITTCDIEVVAGEAVSGTITPLGEPEPIA